MMGPQEFARDVLGLDLGLGPDTTAARLVVTNPRGYGNTWLAKLLERSWRADGLELAQAARGVRTWRKPTAPRTRRGPRRARAAYKTGLARVA